MHDKQLEKIASTMYEPKMPYHNFGHAITVTRFSEGLIEKCRNEGIAVDENVIYYALLFHDAGYHEDHTALGFETKEAYSADLSEKALRDHGVDEQTIEKVKAAILSTHMDAKCYSNEDKIVRMSDISNLGADYKEFKLNTVRLKEEHELMKNVTVGWDEWKNSARETLELVLRESMDVTSDYYDEDGNSVFHAAAMQNLATLLADDSPTV